MKLITDLQAADLMSISVYTLRKWRIDGRGPRFRPTRTIGSLQTGRCERLAYSPNCGRRRRCPITPAS